MRRVLLSATTAVLATAAIAGAAPARGLTFTDPAGDANGLDGRSSAGSQPGLDVLRVTLSPAGRTARTSGIAVRIDLAGPVPTTPGTTYYVSLDQGGCDIRVDVSHGAQGWDGVYSRYCSTGLGAGDYAAGTLPTVTGPAGTSVSLLVPPDALLDSRVGARVTSITAGSALMDPVFYQVGVHPDAASHPGPYVLGS